MQNLCRFRNSCRVQAQKRGTVSPNCTSRTANYSISRSESHHNFYVTFLCRQGSRPSSMNDFAHVSRKITPKPKAPARPDFRDTTPTLLMYCENCVERPTRLLARKDGILHRFANAKLQRCLSRYLNGLACCRVAAFARLPL